jgi:hypothetical protein
MKNSAFEVRGSGKKTALYCTVDNKEVMCIKGTRLLHLLKDVLICRAHREQDGKKQR